ncbi:MAG: SbcC/MukB-like Walker B domain-containing protein, partial [Desulfohalobium sp.]
GQVAWACVEITGHEEIRGIGVRLRKKPGAESVELTPFVLSHLAPCLPLFLDQESGHITPDLQQLGQRVLKTTPTPTAQVQPFDSVDNYHRFLHREGLFPIDLGGSGKRNFADLWRQVSQPRLDKLQQFLEYMLCPPSRTKKLGFDTVDRLIKDRQRIERLLQRLEHFRALRQELEGKAQRLDQARFTALALGVSLAEARIQTSTDRLHKARKREQEIAEELRRLDEDIAARSEELRSTRQERDKYLGQQTDLNTKYRHYTEYQKALAALPELRKQQTELQQHHSDANGQLKEIATRLETIAEQLQTLNQDIAVAREREKQLRQEAQAWHNLQAQLKKWEEQFQTPIRSRQELNSAWDSFQDTWTQYKSLPYKKRELAALEKRKNEHHTARQTARTLVSTAPELQDSDMEQSRLEQWIAQWKHEHYALWEDQHTQREQRATLQAQWEQLAKGRPPLPDNAAHLVEEGLAVPFANRFEHMGLEEATKWQQRIGPLAQALEPASGTATQDLAHGGDPFFLISETGEPDAAQWESLAETNEGVLAGRAGLAWYTPHGPVWLGAQARAQQMQALQEAMQRLEKHLEKQEQHIQALQTKERLASDLLHRFDAYADTKSPGAHESLAGEVADLEAQGPTLKQQHRLLQTLLHQAHAFDFQNAPEELNTVSARRQKSENERQTLQTEQHDLTASQESYQATVSQLQTQQQELQRQENGWESKCEALRQEEPLEVLEGRMDFSRAEALQEHIQTLEDTAQQLEAKLDSLKDARGGLKREAAQVSQSAATASQELENAENEAARARQTFAAQYPENDLPSLEGQTENDRIKAAATWEQLRHDLARRLQDLARQYELSLPQDQEPDQWTAYLLENLMPADIDLSNQEDKLNELRSELKGVEEQIRTYVEQIRKHVDQEIAYLDRRLHRVNAILESMHFGKIARIRLKRQTQPAYEGLKNLRGAQLSLLQMGQEISLQDFIQQIRHTIYRHGKASLSEDQILDYRSYIRLSWDIEDEGGNRRDSGFSGGEGLGINLAICLSLLFYFGQEQGSSRGQGVLLMALDEAERLDNQSLGTIRRLLDQVACQLVVALPRTIEVPSSVCHMLTPLPQGVTHISIYHAEQETGA